MKLTDYSPFEEYNGCIPPEMYEEINSYLQETLDIGNMRLIHCPWSCLVSLVRKRDGK